MRSNSKLLAVAAAVIAGPVLAITADQVGTYIHSGDSSADEDDFSLDEVFVGSGPGDSVTSQTCGPAEMEAGTCTVTGGTGWGGWGSGWGWGGGGDLDGGYDTTRDDNGGGGGDSDNVACSFGNGDVEMSFDGRTITVRAGYRLTGPGAASSGAYIDGIQRIWTVDFPDQGIGIRTELIPDPNGFIINVDEQFASREYMQPYPTGDTSWEIHLGPLAGFTGSTLEYLMRVAAHEFGHFFFIRNVQPTSTNPSIMADASTGNVLPSDLLAMVEICKGG